MGHTYYAWAPSQITEHKTTFAGYLQQVLDIHLRMSVNKRIISA